MTLRDKFDTDPHNGDWRDDLLVIIGIVFLLTFFSVLVFSRLAERWDVLFNAGITLLALGIYVRVLGKKNSARTEHRQLPTERIEDA